MEISVLQPMWRSGTLTQIIMRRRASVKGESHDISQGAAHPLELAATLPELKGRCWWPEDGLVSVMPARYDACGQPVAGELYREVLEEEPGGSEWHRRGWLLPAVSTKC